MKRKIILALYISLCFTLSGCISNNETSPQVINRVQVGSVLPEFRVPDGNGNFLTNEDFIGKKSLLVFFNTECPDCQRELPKINSILLQLKNDPNIMVVTVAREETAEKTDFYWEQHGFSMPKFVDIDRSVYSLFANIIIPRIYVVNESGFVTWMALEKLDITEEQLIAKIIQQ